MVREYLVASLERDLVGPGWKSDCMEPDLNEVLHLDPKSQPSRFYLTGMLLPLVEEEDSATIDSENSSHIDPFNEDEIPPDTAESQLISVDENKESNKVRSGDGLLTPRSIGITVNPVIKSSVWKV